MKIDHPVQTKTVAAGQTDYIELQASSALLTGFEAFWLDATSNATLTLESTCRPNVDGDGPTGSGLAYTSATGWTDESGSVSLTGPSGSAAGTTGVKHLGNCGASRLRIKIAATTETTILVAYAGKA